MHQYIYLRLGMTHNNYNKTKNENIFNCMRK